MSANDIYLIVQRGDKFRIVHTDADDPNRDAPAVATRDGLEEAIRRCQTMPSAEYGYEVVFEPDATVDSGVDEARVALGAAIHAAVDEFHHLAGQQLPEGIDHWPSGAMLMAAADAYARAAAQCAISIFVTGERPATDAEIVALEALCDRLWAVPRVSHGVPRAPA